MSRIIRFTSSEFRPFPSGFYKVRLLKIDDWVSRYGPAFLFTYEIVEVMKITDNSLPHQRRNLEGRVFTDWITRTTSKNADLATVVRVLSGTRIQEGEEFDLDGLIGKTCYVDTALEKYIVKVIDYFNEEEFKNVSGR